MTDKGYLHRRTERFGKVPEELMHDSGITDGAVRLYAHMHWRYGSNCKNFEGRKSMAELLGVSPTTITNRVNELEAANWIVRRPQRDKRGLTTNFYHVFEVQADCIQWRRAHDLAQPDPLPERKNRKGKGGKPTHGSSTQVEQDQPELSKVVNLGSRKPESIYTDPKIPAPDGTAESTSPNAVSKNVHGLLFDAFLKELNPDMLPAGGVGFSGYMRLMQKLVKAGYIVPDLQCAAQLYRAWWEACAVRPVLTWSVAEGTIAIRGALGLCKRGKTAADTTKYVTAMLASDYYQTRGITFLAFDKVCQKAATNGNGHTTSDSPPIEGTYRFSTDDLADPHWETWRGSQWVRE